MLANIKVADIVNINNLQKMSDSEKKSSESIFDVFVMISKIYQRDRLSK